MTEAPVLEVRNLKKYFSQSTSILDTIFRRTGEDIQAVDDVSLTLSEDESQGVIGESGCGKTTLLRTLMGLYTPTEGQIFFKGQDMAEFGKEEWKNYRSDVQIIFQDPFNSLDPKLSIKESLLEPLQIHGMDDKEKRVNEALAQVELSPPEQYLQQYPKHLSGGEKQRVSIARALIVEPDVILADEPVSMLDVSTQASILKLLESLMSDHGVSMFYISHDLSTVAYVCDLIHVMYLGRLVESAPTTDLIDDPKHPYTQALINAIPIPDTEHQRERVTVEGSPNTPTGIGEGCRFRDRCPERMDICEKTPRYIEMAGDRGVACHLYYEHEAEGESGTTDDVAQEGTIQ